MRKATLISVALLCFSLTFTGGCAKKEMVKPEETAPHATIPSPATPSTAPKGPIAEQPIAAAPVQEIKEAPLQESAAAEATGIALERIYFDFDSFVLSQTARDTLSRNAEVLLKKMPTAKVSLEGHCDERGSDEYNLALGEKRARAAQSYLTTLGVPANRLSIISYGEEKPLDSGHTEEAWGKNRRVEFIILK